MAVSILSLSFIRGQSLSFAFGVIMKFACLLFIALFASCSAFRDTRLDGTWVSDRTATVAYNRTLDPNMDWEKYSQLFGHLRLTYDQTTLTSDFKGRAERNPLRLVRKDAESVTIRIRDELDKKYHLATIHFVHPDTYWILIRDTDHREYFRRVKDAEPSGPANGSQPLSSDSKSTPKAAGSRR